MYTLHILQVHKFKIYSFGLHVENCNMKTETVGVDFLWNRTVDSLKTSFLPLLWTSSGLRDSLKATPYRGNGKFTEYAQNLQECEKCNLRKAVANLEMPYGCEITVIAQEGLKTCYTSMLY